MLLTLLNVFFLMNSGAGKWTNNLSFIVSKINIYASSIQDKTLADELMNIINEDTQN